MKREKIQYYQMVVRVDDFGIERAHQLPKGTLASEIRENLGLVRAKLTDLLSQQVASKVALQANSNAKKAAEKVLATRLDKIDRTARVLGIVSIRWTRERTNQALLDTGRSFVSELVPLKEQFLLQGVADTFIEDLSVAVDDFQQAIKGIVDARTAGVTIIREFDAALAEALMLVKRFEDLVLNTVSDNRAVMAAWEAARRVVRVTKSKTESESKKDTTSETAAASTEAVPLPTDAVPAA